MITEHRGPNDSRWPFRAPASVIRLVIGAIAFGFLLHGSMGLVGVSARNEIRAAVAEVNDGQRDLLINGVKVPDPQPYLEAFRQMRWFMLAHHSRPVPPEIEVSFGSGSDAVRVIVQRDSDRTGEYWIFFPKYRSTQNNEIGRLYTSVFDH